MLLDEQRRIVDLNPAAERLLGLVRSESLGLSIVERIPILERERASKEWQELLRSVRHSSTCTMVRRDGAEINVNLAASLITLGGRRLAMCVVTAAKGAPPFGPLHPRPANITEREWQVVKLIALGRETPEIAEALVVSRATVRSHVRNLMARLGARTRAQLVAIALSGGMLG